MAFALELVVALLQSFPFFLPSFSVCNCNEKSLHVTANANINHQTVDGQTSDSHRSDCIDSKIMNTLQTNHSKTTYM